MVRKQGGPDYDYPAYFTGEERTPTRRRGRLWPHLVLLAMLGAASLLAVWITCDRVMLEKVVQALVAPCGLLWLGLIVLLYVLLIRRQLLAAVMLFVLLALFTAAGNSIVANWLVESLEKPYVHNGWNDNGPFDLVAVLGGGTGTAPNGNAQATSSGDRVLAAARMYHQGKTGLIICCGSGGFARTPEELSGSEATVRILGDLQIPAERLVQLGGRNTWEEIQNLSHWLKSQPQADLRIGILTSAWHLRRSMALAEAAGIRAQAIGADFQTAKPRREPHLVIPGAANLLTTTRAIKEYLATWLGR